MRLIFGFPEHRREYRLHVRSGQVIVPSAIFSVVIICGAMSPLTNGAGIMYLSPLTFKSVAAVPPVLS